MTTWLFDDQPQMVGRAAKRSIDGGSTLDVIAAAFAAIDREALIQKVLAERGGNYGSAKMEIEAVLIAAGIIPERES